MANILELFWSETLVEAPRNARSPLAALFTSLLAAPTLCLVADPDAPAFEPFASYGGQEVMPGMSLADLLYEELSIEVSEETIVLVEPRSHAAEPYVSSQRIGTTLGNLLVSLGQMGQDAATERGARLAGAAVQGRDAVPAAFSLA
jgi:hypothetical protein